MWDAIEDDHGRIYFANNEGVLRFDGRNWMLFKTPNPVRHLSFDAQGNLYVACLGDFGSIAFKLNGSYEYISIKKLLPADKQKTGGGEHVFLLGKSIYFYSSRHLVQTEKEGETFNTTVWDLAPMNGAFAYDGRLYLNTDKLGLGTFERGKIKIIAGGELLAGKSISANCKKGEEMLICESNGNTFSLKNNALKIAPNFGLSGVIALATDEKNLVAGTMNNGAKILGNLPQEISSSSKEIYHVFFDKDGNLWTAHGGGLTQTFLSLKLRQFNTAALKGNITDMLVKGQQLWVSTTAGLYTLDAQNGRLIEKVKGIETECWDILAHKDHVYIASTDGLFDCVGTKANLMLSGETILHLQVGNESNKLYALGENGGWIIEENSKVEVVKEIPELANSVFEKNGKILFAGTYQDGIVACNGNAKNAVSEGFAQLRLFQKKLYAQGKNLVFLWEDASGAWKESEFGSNPFNGVNNKEMMLENDFVLLLNNGIKVYKNGEEKLVSLMHTLPGKPLAYAQSKGAYWFAYEDIIYWVPQDEVPSKEANVQVNSLEHGEDKIAFAGVFFDKGGMISALQEVVPEISNEDLPLTISFSLTTATVSEQQKFSYKIDGINKEWSNWQNVSQITLQGVSGGNYTLHIKGMDAFGKETPETEFKFLIRAPWYLSGWAYLIYLVILFFVIYLIVFLNQKRLLTKNKKLEEKVAERTKELFDEKAKSDELLLNILPVEVAEELKRTGSLEARQFDEVTVLFTDFVGFTSISEKLSPKELVEEIHYCFKAFDAIIGLNKLEKIKTIGDAYMAVCGMPISDKDHAIHVVEAAKEIHQFIGQYQQERKQAGKPYFEIRMGINSGAVIAGIVGVKKYAYDIWGDTVNTAARMEQNCEPGKINLSGSTFELIKGTHKCTYRGKIEAKNKGRIDMYYVQG
jgi:class 3 adenylate cyclase